MGKRKTVKAAAKIGDVARETGLSVDTIRFYEKKGLLREPARTEGGFRLFGASQVQALRFVVKCQELGFTLDEIRELLILRDEDVPACSHVKELLEQKIKQVSEKMAELGRLDQGLRGALRKCKRAMNEENTTHRGQCPVLDEISRAARK